MKFILLFFSSIFLSKINGQDTFSIVAADSTTREVGSAGASCIDLDKYRTGDKPAFISDLFPNKGAINTQAFYEKKNQQNAQIRMNMGDNPVQIIAWLNAHDITNQPNLRQYGIVGFSGNKVSVAAYTGDKCDDYKGYKTGNFNGIYYSIQGNILMGQNILNDMESNFINTEGDLATKLMAALKGAKIVGADRRCAQFGTSSLYAFINVAKPTDAYGKPSFDISVKSNEFDVFEPIDALERVFYNKFSPENASFTKTESPEIKVAESSFSWIKIFSTTLILTILVSILAYKFYKKP